jgi:multiple sugar transport system substrate-binding protein
MLLSVFMIVVAAGCGSGTSAPEGNSAAVDSAPKSKAPVTIKVIRSAGFTEEALEAAAVEEVKAKYPYITIEWITQDSVNTPESLIASGNIPDIFLVGTPGSTNLTKLGLTQNLDPLLKKNNFDLSRIDPNALDLVRAYSSDHKSLIAVPYAIGIAALYYNKDIFDKFGVPYPKDGMTWDDAGKLAKQVSRTDGSDIYYGLGFAGQPYDYIGTELSLPFVDDKTNKAAINTDGWKKAFNVMKQLLDAQGNATAESFKGGVKMFAKDKNLAMLVATNEIRNFGDINWDMVTLPTMPEAPGTSRTMTGVVMVLTAQSKHPDDALNVINAYLSDKVQSVMAQNGRPTTLTNKSVQAEFGKAMPGEVSKKNIAAIYKNKPAKMNPVNEYEDKVKPAMNTAVMDILKGSKDVNTALREAEEKANQAINGELAK